MKTRKNMFKSFSRINTKDINKLDNNALQHCLNKLDMRLKYSHDKINLPPKPNTVLRKVAIAAPL